MKTPSIKSLHCSSTSIHVNVSSPIRFSYQKPHQLYHPIINTTLHKEVSKLIHHMHLLAVIWNLISRTSILQQWMQGLLKECVYITPWQRGKNIVWLWKCQRHMYGGNSWFLSFDHGLNILEKHLSPFKTRYPPLCVQLWTLPSTMLPQRISIA